MTDAAPVLRLVLGDQLSRSIAALADIDSARDVVLMIEAMEECTYVPHHPRKIAFLFSAMRHFAETQRAEGITVDYRRLDEPGEGRSFRHGLEQAAARHRPSRVVVTEPGEWRVLEDMRGWEQALGVPVEIRPDGRFLCPLDDFRRWAEGRRTLRMEWFYRDMRRRHGLLMTPEGEPEGGRWNYDQENREALPADLESPDPPAFAPDAITREVLDLVAARFGHHFGRLEGFAMPVTATDAEAAFDHFIRHRLPRFGTYQDAMRQGEPFLFHSLISAPLNAGLLNPLDLCRRAEDAYYAGHAPLNAVEGFIRQILGWREYVRGIYWTRMPDYGRTNALEAHRPLPRFYWTGETDMNCLRQVVTETHDHAHAHHIQRLMVTGNFALLAGIDPAAVNAWYLMVYADAYEWVQLPNTHGMALYADGGLLASKPYAASGKYIDRMSDYCRHCRFSPKKQLEDDACPFNALYWDFIARTRSVTARNRRMMMIHKTMDRMDDEKIRALRDKARTFLDGLEYDPPVRR
ncbi:cryptochrome/photolyase family protein [Caenispirillum salinarum]|uniref:cryptochrome/photolyase family protein n=1 Tax=Caenispirillum salinarum TaxID=859058 RepID=UPI00384AC99D